MITFRPLDKLDLQTLNKIRNDCVDFLHDSNTFTLEETEHWYNRLNSPYYTILLDESMIGYFRTSNYSCINNNMYVGMDIAKEYRGKGYAYAAYNIILPYLFKTYNLNKISLEVLCTNNIAINLYKKIGFIQEGIKRQEVLKNGVYIDSIIMSLLKSEYFKTNE